MMDTIYIFNRESIASNYGIGQYVKQLTEVLISSGKYIVNVINMFSEEKEYLVFTNGNLKTYSIPKSDSELIKYHLIVYYILKSNGSFREDRFVCHFNYVDDYNLANIIKLKEKSVIILFTIHYQKWCLALDGNVEYFRNSIVNINKIKNEDIKIYKSFLLEKKFYNISDRIICLSKFTEDIITEIYQIDKSKILTICNSLVDEYVPLLDFKLDQIREKYSFNKNDYIIIFSGRLNRIKGVDYLIKSINEALKIEERICLIIAGDGDFSTCLKLAKYNLGKIRFYGYLDKECLYELYQISNLGVLLSFHEQSSYSMIEMMMFGLPIIISDSTGLKEILVSESMRIHIEYEGRKASMSIEEIRNRIIDAINNEEINSIKKEMRKTYIKSFSNSNLLRIRELYNSLFNI